MCSHLDNAPEPERGSITGKATLLVFFSVIMSAVIIESFPWAQDHYGDIALAIVLIGLAILFVLALRGSIRKS